MSDPLSESSAAQRKMMRKLKLNIISILQQDDQAGPNTTQSKLSFRANSPQKNTSLSFIRIPLIKRKKNVFLPDSNNITQCMSPLSLMSQTSPVNKKKAVSFPLRRPHDENSKQLESEYINTNNSLHLGYYTLNSFFMRTDLSHQAKMGKMKRKQASQPLSVALVPKHTLSHHHQASSNYRNTSPRSTIKHCSYWNRKVGKSDLLERETKNSPKKKEEETKNNDLYKVVSQFSKENRKEINKCQKSLFKKLQFDIRKSERKIKNLLEDLERTRTINDKELKRKYFIKKAKA